MEIVSIAGRSKMPDGVRITDIIYFDLAGMTKAGLMFRRHGPSYLRSLRLAEIEGILREFARDVYSDTGIVYSAKDDDRSLFEILGADIIEGIHKAFDRFVNDSKLEREFMFPLTPVETVSEFKGDGFKFVAENTYNRSSVLNLVDQMPSSFRERVTSWLIIQSPRVEIAQKIKRIVLGGLAMSMIRRDRYQFVIAKMAEDYVSFDESCSARITTSLAHTPPLSVGCKIRTEDVPWLNCIGRMLRSTEIIDRQKCKSLEYYYRSWFQDASERCAFLFMALDAVFGQGEGGYIKNVSKNIKEAIGSLVDEKRLSDLLNFRNSFAHGKMPDIFDSSLYSKYFGKYSMDPSVDVEILAAKCLRSYIFGEGYVPQADPFQEVIKNFTAKGGHFPASNVNSIVAET